MATKALEVLLASGVVQALSPFWWDPNHPSFPNHPVWVVDAWVQAEGQQAPLVWMTGMVPIEPGRPLVPLELLALQVQEVPKACEKNMNMHAFMNGKHENIHMHAYQTLL